MKFSFASLFTKLTLATSVAGALVGCDEPNYPTPTPVTESSVGQARVLVVNAAPGSQGVTTTVDSSPFGAVAPYLGTAAATYTGVSAGQRLFLFNDPANIPSNATAPATPRTVAARTAYLGGTNYTVFVTDVPTRASAGTDQGGIRTVTLTDNLAPPAVATNAKIRFVNLATTATSGSTSYGIYNSLTQASLFSSIPLRTYRATSSGTGTAAVSFANFTEVAAGTYTLDVRSVATTPLVGTQQVITLVAGKIYTFYVRGIAGNSSTPLGISVVTHN
ncbi:DUF4397 domain-containing protein [Hymenobacter glacialis]|uniref:DUF4397 domain-containing protein n=1 Tax=Hymenobacter glacialis TaxID=1908236 RepID=A0A1G1T0S3_9BACT|nr:DUF4397 domain-containing protein [Hymenobacter glacialis]OGX84480.1 hypothetical protein BEN48_16030 [Hymenobacter glacialis]